MAAAPSKIPPPSTRRGDPNVAVILTWFLPGAGHLYLGRGLLALAVFALVEGIYALGLWLSDGMAFEYLDAELRSALAPVLSPEAGNLGAFLWQLRRFGFGPEPWYPRPFPPYMGLGSMLTALSGVLNIVAMVHAHVLARMTATLPRAPDRLAPVRASARPALAVGLAWLVPGLGHLYQGRRLRALLVLVTLVGLFALGTLLAHGSNLSRERHFYYWAGQFLLGLPALASELIVGDAPVTGELPLVEVGLVFACVAGMLNVLAMIDVFGWEEAELFGLPKRGEERAAAAGEGAAGSRTPTGAGEGEAA
jgi:TM2 domain-containing membrane protein YozV